MLHIVTTALQLARDAGATHATADATRARDVEVRVRDGQLEHVQESTTRRLALGLYVDGRFSVATTSDLRDEALARFIPEAVEMTRALEEDPFRALPSPELYEGQTAVDLELDDPSYATISVDDRAEVARAIDAAARTVPGANALLSVTSSVSDARMESWRAHSDGFIGTISGTTFSTNAEASVQDPKGPRPEEYDTCSTRHWGDLVAAADIGRVAAARALDRIGATTGPTTSCPIVVENRAAQRLVSFLLAPLMGGPIQQKRSFLEGRVGEQVASPLFTLTDDPCIVRGLGSRTFDREGIAAKPFALIESGVLRNIYVDTYYGRKLAIAPTTASPSNLLVEPGTTPFASLLRDVGDGVLVTDFLGGNSNSTTGDFSLGVAGFAIRNGQRAEPLAGLNISGNHLSFWTSLVAIGDDPYDRSQLRVPSLVFEGVTVAGT